MRRLFGLSILFALAAAACHHPRPAAECGSDAPIGVYGGILPPPTDTVWYVPPPYYDDTATGGGYYDDGSDSYDSDDDTSSDTSTDTGSDDGWDSTDDSSSSSSSDDSSSSSDDDGWDDPDPARQVQTQTAHPKTMPGEVVTVAGCYVCDLVCNTASGAYETSGLSSHSHQAACNAAQRRLQRNFNVTACLQTSRIGDHP